VDQNFFMVCSTVPVACTVTVSPFTTAGPLPPFRVCDARERGGGGEGRREVREGRFVFASPTGPIYFFHFFPFDESGYLRLNPPA
jgi:hypothetical protein